MKTKMKNPYFWVGLVGVTATAMGLDLQTLTSWTAVQDAFIELISNPVMIVSVIMAVVGVFNQGKKDKNKDVA